MTDPRDRLLEHALERVLAEEAGAETPDLTGRIVAAWESGAEPALESDALPAREEPAPAASDRGTRRIWYVPAAAAAAVLTFVGVRSLRAPLSTPDMELAAETGAGPASAPASTPVADPVDDPAPTAGTGSSPGEGPTSMDGPLADPGTEPPAERTGAPAELTTDDEQRLAKLFDSVAYGAEAPGAGGFEWMTPPPLRDLSEFAARSPAHRAAVEAAIEDEFDPGAENTWPRGRLLDYLVFDPSPAAYDLGRRLWMQAPATFEDRHLVGFAERGAFEFDREIRALVADDAEAFEDREPPLLPAAYLALRGWEEGRHLLDTTGPVEPLRLQERLAAAAALERLGDPEPWNALMARLRTSIEDDIERGELELAKWLVLGIESFRGTLAEPSPRLSLLAFRALEHVDDHREQLLEAQPLRNLLLKVTGD